MKTKTLKPDLESVILSAINEALSNTHTTLIAKVTKVNKTTINCKPVISRVVNNKKVDLPEFIDVPVINFLGGSSSIQMPISVGDYCVLFVSERCFDNWYYGNDFEAPLEERMHDYSDSIAIVGLKNKDGELDIPKVITILGDTYQKGNYTHDGNRVQNGNFTLNGNEEVNGDVVINGNLTVNGNITCTGTIAAGNFTGLNGGALTTNVDIITTADVKAGSISLKEHIHIDGDGEETSKPQ